MPKILMVCMGNICRSPMARIVAKQLIGDGGMSADFVFDAAGTHAYHAGELPDQRARNLLEKRGYKIDKVRSRPVKASDFESFDVLLAMDRANLSALQKVCPTQHLGKLHLFLEYAGVDSDTGVSEVPDPYYGNLAGFERVLELCEAGAKGLPRRHSQQF
jgi:protein-tyrosine phosphatase